MKQIKMAEILKVMFAEYNKVVNGDYFVDSKRKEVGFINNGGSGKICDIEEIEMVGFCGEVIYLEANESWQLTDIGPEF